MEPDALSIARLRAGDASALGELYDRHGGYVYAIACRVVRDQALAEDVTQEVFCKLWENPEAYDPDRGSLRTFVGVLTHRRSVDVVRRTEAARRRDLAANVDLDRPQPDVLDDVTAHLVATDARAAVDALPDEQRIPIMLAYFRGYTFRELAVVLGIPEGTAKSRIRLGLRKLRAALDAQGVRA